MKARDFDAVARIVQEGVAARAFPAAVVEVGRAEGPIWRQAFGQLTYATDAPECREDTLFDLASLTKVIATTPLAMRLVDRGALVLETPVAAWAREWVGPDRADVTVSDLLTHASGLSAYLPLYIDHRGRVEFERTICRLPLEYPPRSGSLYSDLGFMLLAFILEDAGGARFADQSALLLREVVGPDVRFGPVRDWPAGIAPTEVDPWRGRLLVGEVHDENAWALGGAAGHAGLFGTAPAVGTCARRMLRAVQGDPSWVRPETGRRFVACAGIPGSSRALGWDTMLPTSSCGRYMSARAFGHTGFTGTSLWVDPENDAYVVFLTNRVHPTRLAEGILTVRRALHEAVMRIVSRRRPPGGHAAGGAP